MTLKLIYAALASVVLVTGCSGPSPRVAFVQDGADWRQISLSEARSLQRQEQAAAKTQVDQTQAVPQSQAEPQSSAEPKASAEPMSAIPPSTNQAEVSAPAQNTDLAAPSGEPSAEGTDKTSVSIAKDVCNIPGGQNPTSTPPCTL